MFDSVMRWTTSGLIAAMLAGCSGCNSIVAGGSNTNTNTNSNTIVTVNFTGDLPTAVAARIGSGSLATATLNSGTLSLQIPSGTSAFEVAYFCPMTINGGGGVITVNHMSKPTLYSKRNYAARLNEARPEDLVDTASGSIYIIAATTLDGVSYSAGCSATTTTNTYTTGILSGIVDASAFSNFWMMDVTAMGASGDTTSGAGGFSPLMDFSFSAPAGNDRVLIRTYGVIPPTIPGGTSNSCLIAAKNWSSQAVPGTLNGGNTVVLSSADQTMNQPITYNNIPAGFQTPSTYVYFVPSGIQTVYMIADVAGTQYPALPSGAVQSGDYYSFQSETDNGANLLFVNTTTTSGGPITINFPAPWSYAGPTPAALPTFNFAYSGFTGTGTESVELSANWWPDTSTYIEINFLASQNYMNGSTLLAFPDLSSLSGFPPPPATGNSINWTASISQSTYGLYGMYGLVQPVLPNGRATTVVNLGSYVVP